MPAPDIHLAQDKERLLVQERRRMAGLTAPAELGAPAHALALSGGGIRSATFCLGLVRALAKSGELVRFDYLSTVSGGGYFGSAWSRLYARERDATVVQQGVGRDDSVWLWWLRSNGRYLTPAGLRDLGQAFASILRGVLATHLEVGMLLMVGAGLLLLPYVVLASWVGLGHGPAWLDSFREQGASIWWWAMALPLFVAFHHIFAYWFWRGDGAGGSTAADVLVALLGAAVSWRWGRHVLDDIAAGPPGIAVAASALACVLLLAPATAVLSRLAGLGGTVPRARLRHTRGLARALWWLLIFGVLGALDLGSWWLSRHIAISTSAAYAVPSAAVVIAAVRLLIGKAGDLRKWVDANSRFLDRSTLLNLAGLALLALLVVVWLTAFQWFGDAKGHPWLWLAGMVDGSGGWLPSARTAQWHVLFLGPALYVALTSRSVELLNLSSLHNYYRARIERAYVSTGNAGRFTQGILASRKKVDTTTPEMRLNRAVDGDDVALAAHEPHRYGGPIHLVNCCINQTIDDRTDNYNADRKGVCLTVSALGAETGTRFPIEGGLTVPGTLSMWAAVSGAAASSGMGSQTTPGSAALMFLSGMRLGYWQEMLNRPAGAVASRAIRPKLVMSEAFARFPGLQSPEWYLSDGGHFDNTGVYSLLKRQPGLIVLADCGADPGYAFEDLENLVRKAKIDYACEIEFVAAPAPPGDREPDAVRGLRAAVGQPCDFKPGEGAQCLLLGRVRYADASTAAMVVVKPRRRPDLPLDIVAYGQRHPLFPQQGTGDQFFDEAQWEAYHQLGLQLGGLLTETNLKQLREWALGAARQ